MNSYLELSYVTNIRFCLHFADSITSIGLLEYQTRRKATVRVTTEIIAQSSGMWKFKHKEFETCK